MATVTLYTNPETGLTDLSLIKEEKVIKSIRLTRDETHQLRNELDALYQRTLKASNLFSEPSEVWGEKEGGK